MGATQYAVKLGKANYPENLKYADELERQLDVLSITKHLDKVFEEKQQTKIKGFEAEFASLAEQWYEETLFSSDYLEKILHPAYQRIIGLGREVVPLILNELKDMPSDWFWALRALTGEDPVKEENAGQPEEMAKAWLEWGKKNGII